MGDSSSPPPPPPPTVSFPVVGLEVTGNAVRSCTLVGVSVGDSVVGPGVGLPLGISVGDSVAADFVGFALKEGSLVMLGLVDGASDEATEGA